MVIDKKDNLENKKQEIVIQEKEEAKKKAQLLKIPFIDLIGKDIPAEVLKEIPEEAAAFYGFVPIIRKGNVLEVGMVDPENLKAKEALRFITRRNGLETKLFVISSVDFGNILKQYQSLRTEVNRALKELEEEIASEGEIKTLKGKPKELADKIVAEAPITKIVAVILRHATEGNASDIHIEATEKNVKVRFRVDGILYTSILLPKETHSAIVSRIKILSDLKIDETRVPQDGRFHTIVGGKKIDFRISTLPTVSGEKVVLRVLDPSAGLSDFTTLGIGKYNLEILKREIKQPFGMILITGPTGSGKSTTLYAILRSLNQGEVNIVSLEDPVEYFVEGVNQSQIRPEIKYTFASGLRHILRQDPDIIMVGEIRDEETAQLAIHAALTGHILLSTLYTNDAIGVIPRLIDMKIGSFLLPSSLNLMIAQRLVRRLCEKCKKEVPASTEVIEMIEQELINLNPIHKDSFSWNKPFKIYRPVGCKFCENKGTKGRVALYEMLQMTSQLEEIIAKIAKGEGETQIKEEAKRQGMITMKQDGISKALEGVVAFEEMLRVIEE